tara:strand:+ start:41225 stop:41878 length:654 start_codon:yes stop_codon:yes gene_type:complete
MKHYCEPESRGQGQNGQEGVAIASKSSGLVSESIPNGPVASMELLSRLNKYDRLLFLKIFKHRENQLAILFLQIVSRSSEGALHVFIPVVIWKLGLPGLEILIPLLIVSLGIERSLHWVLKNTLQRPRPQDSIPGLRILATGASRYSFPSGHCSRAFLLATALMLVYGVGAVAMCFWSGAVALSRVLLGVHYPGDVLVGAFVGSFVALFSWLVVVGI